MGVKGSASNILGLFQKDPKYRTLINVKNPELQKRIGIASSDFDRIRQAGYDALGDWTRRYQADAPMATARTAEELGFLNRFYGGGVEAELAALRAQRANAVNAATDRGIAESFGQFNRSRLGGGGGPSTYDRQATQDIATRYRTQAALDDASQARADYDRLQSAQTALLGRRQALADADVERTFDPFRRQQSLYGFNADALAQLANLVHSNEIYGVQRKTTDLDRWINFLNAEQGQFNNTLSTAASLAGGGGGRGVSL